MKFFLVSNSTYVVGLVLGLAASAAAQQIDVDGRHLTFLATFDTSLQADFGKGDRSPRIAEDVSRKRFLDQEGLDGVSIDANGKFGSALRFDRKTKPILCYSAKGNFPYSSKGFDATVAFWMKCDPGKLPAGYIDPLQITDKKWNDASIFVDFNDQRPADFRLGVFSDFNFWNPDNRKFESLKPEERPMVDAGKVKFSKDRWVHIALVFQEINSTEATSQASLFIDGKPVGVLKRKQKFSWDIDQTFMMLGIYYVGLLDDFAVFDNALSGKQISSIVDSGRSLSTLLKD